MPVWERDDHRKPNESALLVSLYSSCKQSFYEITQEKEVVTSMIIEVIFDKEDIDTMGDKIDRNATKKAFTKFFSINEDDLNVMKHIIAESPSGSHVILRIDTKINNRSISWAC